MVLGLMSVLYQLATFVRRALHRRGLLRTERVATPVVSVGNLGFGGSGKTPTVIALTRALHAQGLRVCVISRGYKRQRRSLEPFVVTAQATAAEAGDEPLLIARETGATVVIDRERARGARFAEEQLRPHVILLDDAFSHVRLHRDLDIVLLADGDLRPLALRRELRRTLRDVHLTGQLVSAALSAAALADGVTPVPVAAQRVRVGEAQQPPGWLAGKRVVALAAIARPERFVQSLRSLGAMVVASEAAPDHAPITDALLGRCLARCLAGDADAVIITAKDAIKRPSWPAEVAVLDIGVELPAAWVARVAALAVANPAVAPKDEPPELKGTLTR